MSRDLINLLPPERIRAFRREYFIRLATIAVLLGAAVVVIHGILLFPSYLRLVGARQDETRALSAVNSELSTSGGDVANAELASLKDDATYLSTLGQTPSATAAIRTTLSVPRAGITLTSISFTAPSGNDADGKMTLAGEAATREDLRAYDLALSQLPGVSSADLPISAYAEESDISFSITLTGTLHP